MLPWIHLATATTPDGATLRLLRRGAEFSIRLRDGNELMNSRLAASEEALATLAIERLAGRRAPRILIGGLGMGFTLRAAQAAAGSDARLDRVGDRSRVDRLGDGAHGGRVRRLLRTREVELNAGDVGAVIRAAGAAFDAILLDVDNGPNGVTRAGNDALYGEAGLLAARRALTPGGVLAIWSAAPDPGFSRRLSHCGFATSVTKVRAVRAKRGARHTVWLAT